MRSKLSRNNRRQANSFDALLNPAILFFVLGAAAAFARSDPSVPEAVTKGLSLYLMAAIGLKGGVAVSETGLTGDFIAAGLIGLALSFVLPLPAFALLRRAGLSVIDAGAVAAHYGSVSVVTFVTGSDRTLAPQAIWSPYSRSWKLPRSSPA